jgi:hypothetical protein
MSLATTKKSPRPEPSTPPLVCRLSHKKLTGRRASVQNMGEFELENVSSSPLEISYWMTWLQYLNLVVKDAAGQVLSDGHFGDRFAPTLEPMVLRLEPGEKLAANVHLFATVRGDPMPQGTYFVQAEYEYDGWRCVSEPVSAVIE